MGCIDELPEACVLGASRAAAELRIDIKRAGVDLLGGKIARGIRLLSGIIA